MPFRYVEYYKGIIITTIVSRDVIKKAGLRQSFLAVSFKVAEKAGGDIFLTNDYVSRRSIVTFAFIVF